MKELKLILLETLTTLMNKSEVVNDAWTGKIATCWVRSETNADILITKESISLHFHPVSIQLIQLVKSNKSTILLEMKDDYLPENIVIEKAKAAVEYLLEKGNITYHSQSNL